MIYNKNIILEVLVMPKYKLSPEERAAEKERKDNLRNIMKGLDTVVDFGHQFSNAVHSELEKLSERRVF